MQQVTLFLDLGKWSQQADLFSLLALTLAPAQLPQVNEHLSLLYDHGAAICSLIGQIGREILEVGNHKKEVDVIHEDAVDKNNVINVDAVDNDVIILDGNKTDTKDEVKSMCK